MVQHIYNIDDKDIDQLREDIEEFDGWLSGYKSLVQEAEIDHSEDPRGAALEVIDAVQQELFLRVLR